MRKLVPVITAWLALWQVHPLLADEAQQQNLRKFLTERFPAIAVQSIHASTDLPGYYEVVTPTEIVYADATGAHLIIGKVMDTATRENLTEKRWYDLNRIDFDTLPLQQAIKIVKGNGSRKLAIFADPFCPYCKAFEQTLQGVTDVTIYVFLFPLESLHPGATEAAKDIWCAPSRAQAWTEWMLNGTAVKKGNCSNPVDATVELGDSLKIIATPTLVFSDGLRVPGVISEEQLQRGLNVAPVAAK